MDEIIIVVISDEFVIEELTEKVLIIFFCVSVRLLFHRKIFVGFLCLRILFRNLNDHEMSRTKEINWLIISL